MGAKEVLDKIRDEVAPVKQALGQVLEKLEPTRQFLGKAWDVAQPAFDHGRSEAAAALFSGSAYVMYQRSAPGPEDAKGLTPEGVAPEGLTFEGIATEANAPEGITSEGIAQPLVSPEKPMGMDELRALAREAKAARGMEPECDNELEL
ncbi:hypothetical protein GobsT_14320 [Gemmata obscuriglobus]|uniref:Uncharacterized protein n=1 Tax=Gemmata obscuriglobus TaxID=114 RepID=A0A2Z3H9B4_9BACT|nr:hypothetical protein [Gemmata obscuriglobus]AWM40137.1 hypothetical protein C1280_26120 [Gemmata obscuriglobus]QEG26687.1 hypothetical protein GobsT_14320 [Gemmata obscuriglobus]VTS02350.1 unnamed protein product [Gemmata obscuriglobus UQM 2246]